MPDIKIKRYADKENLKKLVKYSKDTFAKVEHTHTKAEITDFPALATVATTGSYNDLLDKPTSFDADLDNYYTKKQIDILLKKVIVNQKVLGGAIYDSNIDEYNNETEQTMKTVSAVVEPTSVNTYTIVENSDTVEEL